MVTALTSPATTRSGRSVKPRARLIGIPAMTTACMVTTGSDEVVKPPTKRKSDTGTPKKNAKRRKVEEDTTPQSFSTEEITAKEKCLTASNSKGKNAEQLLSATTEQQPIPQQMPGKKKPTPTSTKSKVQPPAKGANSPSPNKKQKASKNENGKVSKKQRVEKQTTEDQSPKGKQPEITPLPPLENAKANRKQKAVQLHTHSEGEAVRIDKVSKRKPVIVEVIHAPDEECLYKGVRPRKANQSLKELAAERAMLPHPLPDLYTLCATLDLKRDVGDLMMQAFETGTKRERKGKKAEDKPSRYRCNPGDYIEEIRMMMHAQGDSALALRTTAQVLELLAKRYVSMILAQIANTRAPGDGTMVDIAVLMVAMLPDMKKVVAIRQALDHVQNSRKIVETAEEEEQLGVDMNEDEEEYLDDGTESDGTTDGSSSSSDEDADDAEANRYIFGSARRGHPGVRRDSRKTKEVQKAARIDDIFADSSLVQQLNSAKKELAEEKKVLHLYRDQFATCKSGSEYRFYYECLSVAFAKHRQKFLSWMKKNCSLDKYGLELKGEVIDMIGYMLQCTINDLIKGAIAKRIAPTTTATTTTTTTTATTTPTTTVTIASTTTPTTTSTITPTTATTTPTIQPITMPHVRTTTTTTTTTTIPTMFILPKEPLSPLEPIHVYSFAQTLKKQMENIQTHQQLG